MRSGAENSLLITRPLHQAKKDTQFFASKGVNVLLAPMLEIKPLEHEPDKIEKADAFIFTSANALRFFPISAVNFNGPVFCVGNQTANAAREAGFSNIHSAQGNAHDLIAHIQEQEETEKSGQYCYIHGKYITADIAAALNERGIKCESVQIYNSVLKEHLTGDVIAALNNNEIQAVSFMSQRSAQNFVRLVRAESVEKSLQTIKALCLSPSVLECVRVLKWKSTHVCARPDGDEFRHFCLQILKDHNEENHDR
ncbi:MAG: uroporphyrinogen-III synthase [Alphaproteobacteria bacterium]